MKIAFSTNAYKQATLEAAIDSIASLGYRGVELMADVPHAYPRDMPADRIVRIRAQLAARNLEISNINAFTLFAQGDTYHPTWIEDDLREVAKRIRHTQDVIRMTAALAGTAPGAASATISLQPGGPRGSIPRDTALRRFEAGLQECLPLAQQHNITLMIEPEPGLLIQHSRECVEFLERINHLHLRMNCDLGHFYCVEEDPATVLRTCAPWIAHIHLEDIKENRVHQHHIPGTGAMDWPSIFDALRETSYVGWLTVELYPFESTAEEAARQAWTYLQAYLH